MRLVRGAAQYFPFPAPVGVNSPANVRLEYSVAGRQSELS
jgi:hypothetical protein